MRGYLLQTDKTHSHTIQISKSTHAHNDAARRGSAGFTMPEVLLTLGIIIILLAISMPFVSGLRENLKMLELDTKAKEVYVATQDRLTNLFVSGEYQTFKTAVSNLNDTEKKSNKNNARRLGDTRNSAPPDYQTSSTSGTSGTDGVWDNFYYITSEDKIYKDYLLTDPALKALEGNFIIEFSPDTADVYSVFYSEEHTLDEMLDAYKTLLYEARTKDDRRGTGVGYYSGNALSTSRIPNSFAPQITVVNGEELYLTISCDGMLKFSTTLDKLTMKLTLTDEHGNSIKIEKNGKDQAVSASGDTVTWNLLLDSMRTGEHFADITKNLDSDSGTGLTPGDNITAKVEFVYSYLGKVIGTDVSSENTAIFNSLFAEGTDVLVSSDGEIKVNRVRHLNNLRSSIFNASKEEISKVTQTGHIDFDYNNWAETYNETSTAKVSEWCPTTADDDKVNPLTTFEPIENVDIFGNESTVSEAVFNGQGNEIRNFIIKSASSGSSSSNGTGLLAYTNCNLENITIVDPTVTGGANTGALAGNVYGGKIEKCGVRLATRHYLGTNKGVDKDAAEMKASVLEHTVSGGNCVGGLIGTLAGDASVVSSYAAINVSGTSNSIGGLVGLISTSGSIKDCYSSGDVTTSGLHAGGIAGQMTSGSIEDCYSTSDITKATVSGGFVGYVVVGSIENCVSYGSVENKADSAGFTAATSSGTYSNCKYLYQSEHNDKFGETEAQRGITREFYSNLELKNGNSVNTSFPYSEELFRKAFSFKLIPTLNTHYGDWPEQGKIDTSLVYFEKYVSKVDETKFEYGYYGQGRPADSTDTSMTWTLDTLLTQEQLDEKGYVVKEDGYAILTMYNVNKMTYNLNNSAITGTITRASDTDGDGIGDMKASTNNGAVYTGEFALIDHPERMEVKTKNNENFTISALYVFQLPFELQEERTGTSNSYNYLKIKGYMEGESAASFDYEYYYCPHFAKSVVGPDVNKTEAGKTDPNDIYVRTARQLNALGRYYYYWNTTNSGRNEKFIFHQELDLDYKNYTKTYCGVTFNLMDTKQDNKYRNIPIGQDGSGKYIQFKAEYYGNGFEIKDYCLEVYDIHTDGYTFKYAGIFGEIKDAKIYDVHMVSTSGDSYVISHYLSTNGTGGVGGLVGLIYNDEEGTSVVKNCSISGYTVKYETTGTIPENIAVGGLAGMCTGELTNSSAVCKLVTAEIANSNGKNVGVGGLVGSKKAGTLEDCYAGGEVSINVKSGSGTHTVGGVSGGNVHTWIKDTNVKEDYLLQNCYSYVYADSSLKNTFYAVSPTNSGCYYVVPSGSKIPTQGSATKLTAAQLTGYTDGTQTAPADFNTVFASFGNADAAHSYPWTDDLKNSQYPFPAVVKTGSYAGGDKLYYGTDVATDIAAAQAKEEYVHYGDWLDADGKWLDAGEIVIPDPDPEPEPTELMGQVGFMQISGNRNKKYTYDFDSKSVDTGSKNVLTNVTSSGCYLYVDSSFNGTYGTDWVLRKNDENVAADEVNLIDGGGGYEYMKLNYSSRNNTTYSIMCLDNGNKTELLKVEIDRKGSMSKKN